MAHLEQKQGETVPHAEYKEDQIAVPNVDIIVISGPSGVGKTGIAETLARWYGIPAVETVNINDEPAPRFVRAGVMMREWYKARERKDSVGYIDRTEDVDTALDQLQEFVMAQANKDHAPLILEGRLAGYLLDLLKSDGDFDKTSVSLLITAEDDIRKGRLGPREKKKLDRYSNDELIRIYGTSMPTIDDIWKKEASRSAQDIETWRNLHPSLHNPFDPDIFDKTINSGLYGSLEESTVAVHEYLVEHGFVEEI